VSIRVERLVPVLRDCLKCVQTGDRTTLIAEFGAITPVMAQLYSAPLRHDHRGDRIADPGAGDALLYSRWLRESVAAMPSEVGTSGVEWSPAWMVATLDFLILLLER
jgi:hypothetical protein